MAYGLWKWRLNSGVNYENTAEKLIISSVNNTLSKEKNDKIKLFSKDYFDINEKPVIIAEVYDENGNKTITAKVTGILSGLKSHTSLKFIFTPKDDKYITELNKLPADDYYIELFAESGGVPYSSIKKRILVDTSNLEFKITKSNFENLRELSGNTGGKFMRYEIDKNYSNISDTIKQHTKGDHTNYREITKKYDIWQNKYVFILIILLLTFEWIMKKRNNLP